MTQEEQTQPIITTMISIKKTYYENNYLNYIKYYSLEDVTKEILDESACTFEVLNSDLRKIYMDIEYIPFESSELIYDIISKFKEFTGMDDDIKYSISRNDGSEHTGLSYHVVFQCHMHYIDVKHLIKAFCLENIDPKDDSKSYANYIDDSVYGKGRLFRLPFNFGIPNNPKTQLPEDEVLCKENVHKIINDMPLESFLINYIAEVPEFKSEKVNEVLKYHRLERTRKRKEIVAQKSDSISSSKLMQNTIISAVERLTSDMEGLKATNEKLISVVENLFNRITELEHH